MLMVNFVICGAAFVFLFASSPVRGVGRWIAPETTAAAILVAIFGIRPLFTDRFQVRSIYGYLPSDAGQQQALFAGITVLLAMCVGAIWANRWLPANRARRGIAPRQLTPPKRVVRLSAARCVRLTLLANVAYFVVFASLSGISTVLALRNGRSSDLVLASVPEIVLLMPLAGSLLVAMFLIERRGEQILPHERVLLLLCLVDTVVLISQLGARRFVIPAVLIPAAAALMRRPARVNPFHLLLAAVSVIFLAIVPFVRSAGAREPGQGLFSAAFKYFEQDGLAAVVRPIFTSFDTEMFDYLALVAGRQQFHYGLGQGTVLEFLTRPLPAALQIGGVPFSDQLLTSLYGGGCGHPVCPVASVAGVLYFDGGLLLVAVGGFFFGGLLRRLAIAWAYNGTVSARRSTYVAVACGFALVAARTNTVHATWWCLYSLLGTWALYTWVSRPPMSKRPSRRDQRQAANVAEVRRAMSGAG